MWPYFLLFLLAAVGALTERTARMTLHGISVTRNSATWIGITVLIALFIGFRYEVGGDWGNYLRNLDQVLTDSPFDFAAWNDPGYRFIEWLTVQTGLGIVTVNVVASAIFTYGLARFCKSLPRPWLAVTVAIPYLVVIVAMGYTRQAMAIGCAMVGLVALGRQQLWPFLVWVVIAAMFHKSAVLLLPIAALASTKNRLYAIFWVGVVTALAYSALLDDSVESLAQGYLYAEYESQGALIRLLMNTVPALLLVIYRRRFKLAPSELNLWLWLAAISLGLLAAYFVTPSSTAVDRVALYMLPLQMFVFAHFPDTIGRPAGRTLPYVSGIVIYYAAVLVVWLNFAANATYWVPYRFYPIEAL